MGVLPWICWCVTASSPPMTPTDRPRQDSSGPSRWTDCLPLFHGAQLTIWCPLLVVVTCHILGTSERMGPLWQPREVGKRGLTQSSLGCFCRARLVVLAGEVCGRWYEGGASRSCSVVKQRRKGWSIHWQRNEEVQNMQDKPWRIEEAEETGGSAAEFERK